MSARTTRPCFCEPGPGLLGRAGFTLLEVMIAVGIIAIALVTLLGAQSQSVSIAAAARFDTTAALLAQGKMAELCVQGFEGVSDGEGDFGEDYPGFTWKVEVRELTVDEIGLEGLAGMLKAVDLVVRSRDDEERACALRTFLLKDFQAAP
jgi:general secretion pathway protein I